MVKKNKFLIFQGGFTPRNENDINNNTFDFKQNITHTPFGEESPIIPKIIKTKVKKYKKGFSMKYYNYYISKTKNVDKKNSHFFFKNKKI